MNIDAPSFVLGLLFCMFSDVIFSICNMFVQKAFYYRQRKKRLIERERKQDPEDSN